MGLDISVRMSRQIAKSRMIFITDADYFQSELVMLHTCILLFFCAIKVAKEVGLSYMYFSNLAIYFMALPCFLVVFRKYKQKYLPDEVR